jgi:predicted Zn-dependent peptidase
MVFRNNKFGFVVKKVLKNGVVLLVAQKENTKLATLNILVKAGSIYEQKGKTGLAHLLEHMMFEGSKNFPNFDETLQDVLGDNNAYTCQDYTNYYESLPYEYIQTAIDLEMDRFQNLNLRLQKFNVQKSVVIEEFKETTLQPPLADFWHYILKMAFPKSSYKIPVIGYTVKDVENITLPDLKKYYTNFYNPSQLIISMVAEDSEENMLNLLESNFGKLATSEAEIPALSLQKSSRFLTKTLTRKNIHQTSFFIAFHIDDYGSAEYFRADMLSDLLSNGDSSVLYQRFIKELEFCTEISSFITDNKHSNLLIIEGKLNQEISFERFKEELELIFQKLDTILTPDKLTLLKNKAETYFMFSNYNMTHLAQNICFWEYVGLENPKDSIRAIYEETTVEDINSVALTIFNDNNRVELVYLPKNN